jgi:hypothetical protein
MNVNPGEIQHRNLTMGYLVAQTRRHQIETYGLGVRAS